MASPFEAADSFVGSYGDPSDPIVISVIDGHLFRDTNEFYPIQGGRYAIPASGSEFRFRRNSTGAVDAIITWRASGETVSLRVPARP